MAAGNPCLPLELIGSCHEDNVLGWIVIWIGELVLDTFSLKLALGVVTLTLCVLFFGSFRRTRSPYSAWWCFALAAWLAGNASYVLNGTDQQWWANPVGNALLVAGAFAAWAGCRSLRGFAPKRWLLLLAPAVTLAASVLGNPAVNVWSGGVVYFGLMGVGMALAARELALLNLGGSQAHRPLLFAAGTLVAFFACRGVFYVHFGPDDEIFRSYFGPAVTCILLIVLLVTVSFSMTALSNDHLVNALSERAARDGMTGLLNRETFFERAQSTLLRLEGDGSVSTVVLADLDHFKAINDTHGHAGGDAAIQAFADACLRSVRRTDIVGRYGGEEFIILLSGADPARALAITKDISCRFASATPPSGMAFPTVSYGIASTDFGPSLPRMVEGADAALYRAKARGRNQAVYATE
ncbi:GGDEF domain-containing protein [Arthrobacter sp. AL08]|uniref:GGDEF domain-containing protein n=1 Tax=unclassified Arthrobacter TaxID=235627 RepID=UPI00249BC6A0|nr:MULTISPECIES: GGDEF domain-containing protein [unclassified Arthrobacter]MDI3243447.1 GGDEF domain-containing protein [Arthrobacter sp. AL05]MDI3279455.1 GGDEF domain-containing protein [Arthrobacter sp. AL08]